MELASGKHSSAGCLQRQSELWTAMQVSGSNYQYLFTQQNASTTISNSNPSNNGGDELAAFSSSITKNNAPTQQQISSGYFGSPSAKLASVLASGGTVNVLSYLTSSDIALIDKATGITVKDGNYYNSAGKQVGIHYDSQGNLAEPNGAETLAAVNLAQTLSELRQSGGPQGNTSLQNGGTITAGDLQTYLNDYAAADAKGQNTYVPDADVIKQAEAILQSEQNSLS